MSKELETLYTPLQSLNNIRDNYFLLKGKGGTDLEYRWFNRIETALKALEIITKKMVIPAYIVNTKNVEEYNKWLKEITLKEDWLKRTLTEEEYNLLKEVFE